jgi:hypothetical protein
VHGRQIGESGVHQRFTLRAEQISEIEQAIDSDRRQQGCFHCAGHSLLEQKDRIGSGDRSAARRGPVTDFGEAKPNPPGAPKRPHAGPGGRAGVGAGSPSPRCWGGEQHRIDCQGNLFEIG